MGECAMAGAECLVDLDRTLTDREMADLLRRNGMTPYYFVHLAVVELLVKDNPVASRCYLAYAGNFRNGCFFENYREDAAFSVNLDMAEEFVAMVSKSKKGGG